MVSIRELAILYLKGMPTHAGASSQGRRPHPAHSNFHGNHAQLRCNAAKTWAAL